MLLRGVGLDAIEPEAPDRPDPPRHVINTVEPTTITTADGSEGLLWAGPDDRGLELEVVAVVLPELYLVIHVMPTTLRGGAS
ncbi:MAG: hypothetical protein ACYCZV_13210 [Acidimicrobiales bacterium]